MKHIRLFSLTVLVLVLMSMLMGTAAASSMPSFWQGDDDATVTIPREEYESLLKYQKLEILHELLDIYYYEELDDEALLDGAAAGLMQGVGDLYTFYYTKEDMEAFNEESEGEYAGIGCQLIADPTDEAITVTRVFKGSPAEEAGVRAGDKIVYVNDVYCSAYEMDDAVDVMRGEPGTSVKITVVRGLETMDFDVERKIININYVEHRILDGNIGYVMVYDFLGDAYDGFARAVEEFKAANVSGMIIDLRNNGGGFLSASVDMADLILPEGTVVSTKDNTGYEEKLTIDGEYYDVPMVVLVNGYSASASEILTGAIRDYDAGVIVGTKTFGKGIVQTVIEFPDGTGAQITIARYYTPSGECIHEVGIEPDVVVELDEEAVTLYGINNLPLEHDAQLQKAIELLTTGQVQ
ncbi:MAG: S41 family peptidase [Clostridia bacterium]|nr:S41 family peptidase [Clostridia bacterium]